MVEGETVAELVGVWVVVGRWKRLTEELKDREQAIVGGGIKDGV